MRFAIRNFLSEIFPPAFELVAFCSLSSQRELLRARERVLGFGGERESAGRTLDYRRNL